MQYKHHKRRCPMLLHTVLHTVNRLSFTGTITIGSPVHHPSISSLNCTDHKLHPNRHVAISIIIDPEEYGGLNIPHAYFLQSIGRINLFIGHLQARDKTGSLILISMSNIQITVGSSTPFLHLPYSKYSRWIEDMWLTSIW
jgi:hypothetical protein